MFGRAKILQKRFLLFNMHRTVPSRRARCAGSLGPLSWVMGDTWKFHLDGLGAVLGEGGGDDDVLYGAY